MNKPQNKNYKVEIKLNANNNVVIITENGNLLYTAQNRHMYFAIQECLAFLSSFNNIEYILSPELHEHWQNITKTKN